MREGTGMLSRYKTLGFRDSILKIHQYASACKELSSIIRFSFPKLPKFLQHLLFDDVVFAFRTLPLMEASSAVEAANLLLQAAESVLPKQKRGMAGKEFRLAMVAHKRRWKARQQGEGEGMSQLPEDVLMHIFSFLDLRSLVAAASVSRSWNLATSDNKLWQLQYSIFFADSDNLYEIKILQPQTGQAETKLIYVQTDVTRVGFNWREAFKRDFKGFFSRIFNASSRGYCKHCRSIMWLNDLECTNKHCRPNCANHLIKPISSQKIVKYVRDGFLDGFHLYATSSDSDSDSEEGFPSRLWAYPLCTET
ncbi:F-box domain containing protein [Heracleum sosnowskyi]|uniref:F-box domain containing protein n=1 Tax=Heracleum sosnowskyi TaxID=360622 RepID=A0AAD8MBX0_9APIA|nr:F-box domain containing protein [Heracleum sosnowskyi]